jgi:ParB family chromosome partitioning protein
MAFKDSQSQFEIVDLSLIDPDPKHVRQNVNEDALSGLTNAVRKLGVIHPLIVRPTTSGRYEVIAGERRRLAALQAGETKAPVVIRPCSDDEALEVRVFENIGLGVRAALEPREMANAIQAIAERFATPEEAAQHFGRSPTWLAQATAAANLSEKVTALLDSGKISSTSAAIQLEKLSKKNEAKAESFIEQIEQLPEGEKVSKKLVDEALQEARGKKTEEPAVVAAEPESVVAPREPAQPSAEATPAPMARQEDAQEERRAPAQESSSPRNRVNPGKVKLVAELLGLSEDDEEELLVRLIDEFLTMKGV